MAVWTNDAQLNFLEIYETEPVLWDPCHEYAKDKRKKQEAWLRIAEATNFSVEDLKKKKISLMATYRGIVRERNESLRSSKEVSAPSWFAYEPMNSFLGHLYYKDTTTTTGNKDLQHSTSQNSREVKLELTPQNSHLNDTETTLYYEHDEPSTSQELNGTEGENIQVTTRTHDPLWVDMQESYVIPAQRRRRRNSGELQELEKNTMKDVMTALNKILKTQEEPEDDCDRYAKILANKLRKLPDLERLQLMWEIDGLYIKTIQKSSE